jgi:hypothetical protein
VVEIGVHCDTPYPCDFKAHCWAHVPERSVFELAGATHKKWALYRRGILRMADIPADEPLSAAQRRQVEAWNSGEAQVDHRALHAWLEGLRYPLHFLDFETMNAAVPLYDGTRPYQQLPFQYSLHLQDAPAAPATHREHLATGLGDPREALLRQLLSDVGPSGDILAYNVAFERMVLRDLARDLPQYAEAIAQLLPRMKDLMDPFRKGWYYAPAMNGSNSIKAVLPALVPALRYDDLAIREGGTASLRFAQLAAGTYAGDPTQLRADLLAYCKLDTLAMVEVLGVLQDTVVPGRLRPLNDRFYASEGSIVFPDCKTCIHRNNTEPLDPRCVAFPEGIPLKIRFGQQQHREVVPGQAGEWVYEKR